MKNEHSLQLIVGITLLTVVTLSSFSLFFISPTFANLVSNNAKLEAVKIATHLSDMFEYQDKVTKDLPPDFVTMTNMAIKDFGLMKIKVFTPDGETVYSTSEEDIGKLNKHDYFHNIVAKGGTYTKVVKKNTSSLEGQPVDLDVVETYVPIMKAGVFIGAFEIYFDITENMAELNRLLLSSNVLLIVLGLSLLMIVLFIAFMARSSFIKQGLAEKKIILQSRDLAEKNIELISINEEKTKLIDELQTALSKIKTLHGLLPICMYCKKIKNEKGSWDKLERYVSEHSDADFSHGICPDCLDNQLEQLKEEK